MLKITIHDGPEALTFQVEGKLIGAWAKELEQSWKTASSIRDRKALIVDLTETLYIDEEGKRVLKKLFRDGALFRTAGAMTSSIVDEITGKSAGYRALDHAHRAPAAVPSGQAGGEFDSTQQHLPIVPGGGERKCS